MGEPGAGYEKVLSSLLPKEFQEALWIFSGKRILLGVTGGIAAYKAAEVARRLIGCGARVKVVMTRAAQEFVGPLTFQALTGQKVATAMFGPESEPLEHVALGQEVDAIVVAPATANLIGKLAAGYRGRFAHHHHAGGHPAGAALPGHERGDVGQSGGAGKPGPVARAGA